ncbi:hypothetical protein WR25_26330 [Diploscapter pachys]|uniref:C2H2-type domain-containing protein n=1 Tax=Diploscapter pachys TaxID=2018661 RepID=A0A2A2L6I6_9BILA|nr:hypothetical protein WR25_26330 [Diploscapter pachys]
MITLTCPLCTNVEISEKDLELHICLEHLNEYQPWKCALCQKTRYSRKRLAMHIQSIHNPSQIEMVYVYDKLKEEELERLMDLARLNSQNDQIRSNKDSTSIQNQESSEDASPGMAHQTLGESSSYQEGREIEINSILDGQGQIKQEIQEEKPKLMSSTNFEPVKFDPLFKNVAKTEEVEILEPDSNKMAAQRVKKRTAFSPFAPYSRPETKDARNTGTKASQNRAIKGDLSQIATTSFSSADWRKLRYECKKCLENCQKNGLRAHAMKHLFIDKNIIFYRCSINSCDFTHFKNSAVHHHILIAHQPDEGATVKENTSMTELDFVIKKEQDECFNIDKPTHEVTVVKNPLLSNLENDEYTVHCKLCFRMFRVTANNKRTNTLAHVATHMRLFYNGPRYACCLCNVKGENLSRLIKHTKEKHGSNNCYDDTIINWNIDHVRNMSQWCFGDNRLIQLMPIKWHQKWTASGQNTMYPSTEMIYFFDKSKEDELKRLMEMAKNGEISQKQGWNQGRDEESQQNAELPILSLTSDFAESSGNQINDFQLIQPKPGPNWNDSTVVENSPEKVSRKKRTSVQKQTSKPPKLPKDSETPNTLEAIMAISVKNEPEIINFNFNPNPVQEESNDQFYELANALQGEQSTSGVVDHRQCLSRYPCKKCGHALTKNNMRGHVMKHLYQDNQVVFFYCSVPGCDYTHFNSNTMARHLQAYHKSEQDAKYVDNITPKISDMITKHLAECFDYEDEVSGTVVPEEEKKSGLLIMFCRLCSKSLRVTPNNKATNMINHVSVHMRSYQTEKRFVCNLCPQENTNWDIKHVKAVSEMCFGDDQLVGYMPQRWHARWGSKIKKRSVHKPKIGLKPSTSQNHSGEVAMDEENDA